MGINMSMKPPTMRSVAVSFQPSNGTFLTNESSTALMGMPRMVPKEIKIGNVNAIPKLMKKLKSSPRPAAPHTKFQGT